jgi:putative membrane protein
MSDGRDALAGFDGDNDMRRTLALAAALALSGAGAAWAQAAGGPSDPQIAHIAYTADQIDIKAAEQALAKTQNPQVRSFAEEMKRDHAAVNDKALALVKKLGVTPEANPTSAALSAAADQKLAQLKALNGAAFDRAYIQNEVTFHQTVNTALKDTLIPNADNPELKSLLETGLKLFQEHQAHAEHLAHTVR